jgi:hypothetical protein
MKFEISYEQRNRVQQHSVNCSLNQRCTAEICENVKS